jgi:hypothetical protein
MVVWAPSLAFPLRPMRWNPTCPSNVKPMSAVYLYPRKGPTVRPLTVAETVSISSER